MTRFILILLSVSLAFSCSNTPEAVVKENKIPTPDSWQTVDFYKGFQIAFPAEPSKKEEADRVVFAYETDDAIYTCNAKNSTADKKYQANKDNPQPYFEALSGFIAMNYMKEVETSSPFEMNGSKGMLMKMKDKKGITGYVKIIDFDEVIYTLIVSHFSEETPELIQTKDIFFSSFAKK